MEPTYLLVDGENIDATLGMSVLDRRPTSEERPRWDRVLEEASKTWGQPARGLFFLNGSSGTLPMSFVQALMAMEYHPIPLAGPSSVKVVDVGIQRTLEAIAGGPGSVILASHDCDFVDQIEALLDQGRHVAVVCFREFLSSSLNDLVAKGLEILDLEYDFNAFQVTLPRIKIIEIEDYNPYDFL